MVWFDEDSDQAKAYDQVTTQPNESNWSEELISSAAAYEAAKAYEDYCARNGEPQSSTDAKEILAGAIGAFVDREIEIKGLDYIDREKAKLGAQNQVEKALAQNDNKS